MSPAAAAPGTASAPFVEPAEPSAALGAPAAPELLRFNASEPAEPSLPAALAHFCYFLAAPTLVFEPAYPRFPPAPAGPRASVVLSKLGRGALAMAAAVALGQQFVAPVLARPRPAARAAAAAAFAADLLELAVPSLLIWLLCWYSLLHCGLSALAEALCFGDRRFSADWCE